MARFEPTAVNGQETSTTEAPHNFSAVAVEILGLRKSSTQRSFVKVGPNYLVRVISACFKEDLFLCCSSVKLAVVANSSKNFEERLFNIQ